MAQRRTSIAPASRARHVQGAEPLPRRGINVEQAPRTPIMRAWGLARMSTPQSFATIGTTITRGGNAAHGMAPESPSAFDVWTHSYDGMSDRMQSVAANPASLLTGDPGQVANVASAAANMQSSSASQVAGSISAQASALGDSVNAIGHNRLRSCHPNGAPYARRIAKLPVLCPPNPDSCRLRSIPGFPWGSLQVECAPSRTRDGPLAQLVEQETLNLLVVGSTPTRPTNSMTCARVSLVLSKADAVS